MVVNPAAEHVGGVVLTVGATGVGNIAKFVKLCDAPEIQVSVLVAVTVYAVPIVAPVTNPDPSTLGPVGLNVYVFEAE